MRKRKEIEHSYKAPISCSPRGFEELKLELLLDIRELLIGLGADKALMAVEHEGEVSVNVYQPKIHFFMPSGSIACARKGALASTRKLEEVTCDDCKISWHELNNPPVDCNVIPDPKKLMKAKNKLDKLLRKT